MPNKSDSPKKTSDTKKSKPKKTKRDYIFAVGRRKEAIARVRLYLKKGPITVNKLEIDKYFPGKLEKISYLKPLVLTNTKGKFSASIKVHGSGKNAQLDAVTHGLSRALVKHDEETFKKTLRDNGFLTRDPRMKESRKVGTGGKARRKKQSPKR